MFGRGLVRCRLNRPRGQVSGLTGPFIKGGRLRGVCYDWQKLRIDPTTGEEQVCGANISPAAVFYWLPAGPMPGGVHDAGQCPGVPLFQTFARSTDDYMIWCAEGTSVNLPGNRSVTDPPQPIWGLYSP